MSAYTTLLRPLLFALPAEAAHDLAKVALHREFPWRGIGAAAAAADPRLEIRMGGRVWANPVGLSAGFDKNAEAIPGLQHLGFGYLTVGSVMPEARPGNPKPRLIRYPETESLGNCYGLPSRGVEDCVRRLAALKTRRTPVIANIDAPTVELYCRSFDLVEPHVDAIELGLQCPNNTQDHGEFHEPALFERLLGEIAKRRSHKPVFMKLVWWATETELQNRLDLVDRAVRFGIAGVNLPAVFKETEPGVSLGTATITGRRAFQRTLQTVKALNDVARGRMAIKANGGIHTGAEVFEVLAAGATSVDILSAFVYRGWSAASDITRELLAELDTHRLPDVRHLSELAAAA